VPGILNEAVPATTQNVDSEIQRTVRDAYKYTGLIEKICYNERDDPPAGLSVLLLKQSLINSRQHEAFLRVLLVSLNAVTSVVFSARVSVSPIKKYDRIVSESLYPRVNRKQT